MLGDFLLEKQFSENFYIIPIKVRGNTNNDSFKDFWYWNYGFSNKNSEVISVDSCRIRRSYEYCLITDPLSIIRFRSVNSPLIVPVDTPLMFMSQPTADNSYNFCWDLSEDKKDMFLKIDNRRRKLLTVFKEKGTFYGANALYA